jgi:predicted negative regulator of RcsB-dependent stress response
MDEEVSIIDSKTRHEKIKNFFLENKKKIIYVILISLLMIFSFLGYGEFKDAKKKKISNLYNLSIIEYKATNKEKTFNNLKEIVLEKDPTYSPLSLYFIIDNDLIDDKNKINDLFDILINKTSLEEEIKNLIIYKKALFNADEITENNLLKILNPLINSESVWKSHALYLISEYFYAKDEKQKSKDFFNQLVNLENANQDLLIEARKRLNRDLSD